MQRRAPLSCRVASAPATFDSVSRCTSSSRIWRLAANLLPQSPTFVGKSSHPEMSKAAEYGSSSASNSQFANRSAQEHLLYIQEKVNPILEALVTAVLLERPEDPSLFMLKWLCEQTKSLDAGDNSGGRGMSTAEETETVRKEIGRLKDRKAVLLGRHAASDGKADDVMSDTTEANEEEEEEEDDEDISDVMPEPLKYNRGPRQSVSAEAYGQWNQRGNFVAPVYEKSDEQKARIEKCLEPSFLFSGLERQDLETIVLACKEKIVDAGTRIIEQGDDGESMFVIEKGKLDCLKKIDDEEKVVKTCAAGDVFGELALLYNCPRAASVECKERATLWELDRETFKTVVKDAAMRKRDIYSEFLRKVPLFANIDQYEMMTIADAVKVETHSQDECIIAQGDMGESFYITLEGECVAKKVLVDGQPPQQMMTHQVGDHFGELALIRNAPRAASVYASSAHVKLLCLDRKTFKRLLGPLEDVLRREAQRYEVPMTSCAERQ